jgi:hypothetical protein
MESCLVNCSVFELHRRGLARAGSLCAGKKRKCGADARERRRLHGWRSLLFEMLFFPSPLLAIAVVSGHNEARSL